MISMGSLAAGLLLAFFIVGVPVPFALGGASALAMLLNGSSNMVIVCQRMFQGINSFPYLARIARANGPGTPLGSPE